MKKEFGKCFSFIGGVFFVAFSVALNNMPLFCLGAFFIYSSALEGK